MFACTFENCDVTCKSKQGLSSHLKQHERETGNTVKFTCPDCNKVCSTKAALITHERAHQKNFDKIVNKITAKQPVEEQIKTDKKALKTTKKTEQPVKEETKPVVKKQKKTVKEPVEEETKPVVKKQKTEQPVKEETKPVVKKQKTEQPVKEETKPVVKKQNTVEESVDGPIILTDYKELKQNYTFTLPAQYMCFSTLLVSTKQCEMDTKPVVKKQTCEQVSEVVYNTAVCPVFVYEQVNYESESEETVVIDDKCDAVFGYEHTEYECCQNIEMIEYQDAEFDDISTEVSIECQTTMLDKCDAVFEYQTYECECDFALVVFDEDAGAPLSDDGLNDCILYQSECQYSLHTMTSEYTKILMNRVFDRVWNDNMIVKIPEPIVQLPNRTAVIEYQKYGCECEDQFRCLVCLEHVSDVTKCPKCSAMYCDPCYERCQTANCAQCRQSSDLFVVDEPESSDDEPELTIQDAETEFQHYSRDIIDLYRTIRRDYVNQPGFNYNLTQVDDAFMRLIDLILQSARNGIQSIVRHLPVLPIHINDLQGAVRYMQFVDNIIDEFRDLYFENYEPPRQINPMLIFDFARGSYAVHRDILCVLLQNRSLDPESSDSESSDSESSDSESSDSESDSDDCKK